jgi:hypothetical protein
MIWISKMCPLFYLPSSIAALRRDGWNSHDEGRKRDLKGHNYQSQEYVMYQGGDFVRVWRTCYRLCVGDGGK